MGKKKKGKYTGKTELFGTISLGAYSCLLLIPVGLLFLALKGTVFGRILLSACLVYFSYFWKKDNPIGAKGIMIITACMPWFTVLGISQRQLLLAETVLLFVSIIVLLYWNIVCRCSHGPVLIVALYFLLSMMTAFNRYTYAEDGTDMQHWQIYSICAIAVAVAIGFLASRDIIYLKDDRTSEKIGLCILAAGIGFMLPWATVNNLNYMLDKSDPTVYACVINEKDIYHSSKSGNSYYLIVDCNGEDLKMEVSQSKYDQYEVGTRLPVALYEGAFDKPYYIVE